MTYSMADLPSFFVLGAAKAGTTSLYAYLSQHPDICLSNVKEPHFFDDEPAFAHGLDWYVRQYFPHCDNRAVRGEATPILHLPLIVGPRIREAYGNDAPSLRFIVVLRDPVERAWSHYLDCYRLTTESEGFEEALKLEAGRLAKNPSQWYGYFRDGLYCQQLEAWFELFDQSQFFIILHEELRDSPGAISAMVARFLNVDDGVQFTTDFRRNVAGQPRSRRLMKIVSQPPALVRHFTSRILPQRTRKNIRAVLRRWLTSPYDRKPELDAQIAHELRARFQPDIQRLEKLIDRDLSAWQP